MDEDEEYPEGPLELYPCSICGRNFNPNTLRKHQVICQKTSTKKRREFDSGKQRATGSDVVYEKTKLTKKVQEGLIAPPTNTVKKEVWREKHDEMISSIRNARAQQHAEKTGAEIPKFKPSAVPSDYVQCPYCNRNFNSSAAERHIPFCQEQQKRQKVSSAANSSKAKQEARIKYQPPRPGGGDQRKKSSDIGSKIPMYNQTSNHNQYQNQNQMKNNSATITIKRNSQPPTPQTPTRPFKSSSECAPRKPLKYESQHYEDDDDYERSRALFSIQNKANSRNSALTYEDQLLRTGRNVENNAINSLARKRSGPSSQKTSPQNSSNHRSPPPTYKTNFLNNKKIAEKKQGTSKFCCECGTQFPVEWAKYCCLCGEKRA